MKRDETLSWRRVDASTLELAGTNVAVVGGTGGIGRAISRLLASRGARVTVVGRTMRDPDIPGLEFIEADLGLMREARRVATELPAETLDLIVLTTGIMAGPEREVTAEGIERDMAISYLSRLVLLREIGPRLGKDRAGKVEKPQVFLMGFPGTGQVGKAEDLNAETRYSKWAVHMNTVVGNEMLVVDGATRYPNADLFGLNPGFVKSNIRANLFGSNAFLLALMEGATGFMTASPETYAKRIVPLLVSPDLAGHTGAFFNNRGEAILPTPEVADRSYMHRFLAASEALAARGLKPEVAAR